MASPKHTRRGGEEHASGGRDQHVVGVGVHGEARERQPHDHLVRLAQPPRALRHPQHKQGDQQAAAKPPALHRRSQMLVVRGPMLPMPRHGHSLKV